VSWGLKPETFGLKIVTRIEEEMVGNLEVLSRFGRFITFVRFLEALDCCKYFSLLIELSLNRSFQSQRARKAELWFIFTQQFHYSRSAGFCFLQSLFCWVHFKDIRQNYSHSINKVFWPIFHTIQPFSIDKFPTKPSKHLKQFPLPTALTPFFSKAHQASSIYHDIFFSKSILIRSDFDCVHFSPFKSTHHQTSNAINSIKLVINFRLLTFSLSIIHSPFIVSSSLYCL
jgi:hypothetical protein